ncbi:MAG: hypothetical protein GX638_14755 [Crenarchaeota archaeon]|nr:hypothetical protein [Thermoproteota archaeon]
MSDKNVKEDPIKMHKDACSLVEDGKYEVAIDLFVKVSELYFKNQNFFGSAEMLYKAGECAFNLKNYEKAVEYFIKSSETSLSKGFDRYGISALECARDAQKASGNNKEVEELTTKINDLNKKLSDAEAPSGDDSFSIFS